MTRRTALITGANRGLGLECCRQLAQLGHRVWLGSRDAERGLHAASGLREQGLSVHAITVDVSQAESLRQAHELICAEHGHVDVLVNNAGVLVEGDALSIAEEELMDTLSVNAVSAWRAAKVFAPDMVERSWGRIVNVSSGYGCFADGLDGPAAYSISKAAMNAITVKLAQALPGSVKVNAVSPGWVRTRMGGSEADRAVAEGAEALVWAATLADDGPTGGFFRNRGEPHAW